MSARLDDLSVQYLTHLTDEYLQFRDTLFFFVASAGRIVGWARKQAHVWIDGRQVCWCLRPGYFHRGAHGSAIRTRRQPPPNFLYPISGSEIEYLVTACLFYFDVLRIAVRIYDNMEQGVAHY